MKNKYVINIEAARNDFSHKVEGIEELKDTIIKLIEMHDIILPEEKLTITIERKEV